MPPPEIIEGTPTELLPRLKSLSPKQRYRLIPLSEAQNSPAVNDEPSTTANRLNAFLEWANSHGPDSPRLSDEAVSRDSIYEGR